MDNLIDRDYFIGEVNIAQLGQSYVSEHLDLFITKYQPKYLRSVLGAAFYSLFEDGYNPATDDRWAKLVKGDDYVDCDGITQHWDGLVDEDSLVSPIANFIYYWYTRDLQSSTTASGEQEEKGSGSTNVGAAIKQSRAWNEMVAMNCKLVDYLLNKKVDGALVYPEYNNDYVSSSREHSNLFTRINAMNL